MNVDHSNVNFNWVSNICIPFHLQKFIETKLSLFLSLCSALNVFFHRSVPLFFCESLKQIKIYLINQIKRKRNTNENEILACWSFMLISIFFVVVIIVWDIRNGQLQRDKLHMETYGNELTKWKSKKMSNGKKMEMNIKKKFKWKYGNNNDDDKLKRFSIHWHTLRLPDFKYFYFSY